MGSCISLNYCNRANSRRSNTRSSEVPDVNQTAQQQLSVTASGSEQITLTVGNSTAPTVDSGRATASTVAACHRSPSFSNRTSNSFQSTCSTQRNSSSLLNNAIITVGNVNNAGANVNSFHFIPPTGKNKRLKKDYLKYIKYDKRISESQLRAKREEFWDTAPAFDGKPEIWAALRAAVDALEAKNYQLAQAIVDSANIILPNGFINDCYDELGNRYQLPVYVLVKPTHLRLRQAAAITEPDSNTSTSNKNKKGKKGKHKRQNNNNNNNTNKKQADSDDCEEDDDSLDSEDSDQNEIDFDDYDEDDYDDGFFFRPSSKQQQRAKAGKKSNSSGAQPTTSKVKKENAVSDLAATTTAISAVDEEPIQVKFRISTMNQDSNNSDAKLMVSLNETVLSVKKKLFEQFKIEPTSQRLFFAGKLLKDKDKLRSHKLKKNVVVQVIVREQAQQPSANVEDKTQLNKSSTTTSS